MSDSDEEYELVYPFLVCQSNGGPYDDDSFVAGVYFGNMMAVFNEPKSVNDTHDVSFTVPSPLLPQIDLLAMRWGCSVVLERHEDTPEWTTVRFTEGDSE